MTLPGGNTNVTSGHQPAMTTRQSSEDPLTTETFHEAVQRTKAPTEDSARRLPQPELRRMMAPETQGRGRQSVQGRDALSRRALVVADVVAAGFALLLSMTIVGDNRLQLASLAVFPVMVFVSKILGLYDRDELVVHKATLDEAPALFTLATLTALLIWLAGSALVYGPLSRFQILGVWVSLFLCLLVGRAIARASVRGVAGPERCLLMGDASARERLRSKFSDLHRGEATLVGFMPLEDRLADAREDALRRADIEEVIVRADVHRVIMAPRFEEDTDAMLHVISWVKGLGAKVSVLPRMFEVVGSSVEHDDLDGVTILGVRRFGLTRSSRAVKRTMDVMGSLAGLVLLSPLFILCALAVRVDGRGILFRQTRVGRDGRRFQMLKFRSMVQDAEEQKGTLREHNEADGLFKIADDPRITRVGSVLRRTSLDELPQLLNVLRGEMSLVGPRPLVSEDDRHVTSWHRRRLHLKPGVTGQWQVMGSSRIPLHEMVTIDYLYVANWSLWTDVKILLRTVGHVLRRRGL